ncbi:MAG: hypothetical protein NT037_05835 [Hyphomicrobiales bacterium]|nr:hypothetical protein [Hyphomicrobiales bacterium]
MTPALSDHDLFRMRLDAMIDARHELVRLAKLDTRKNLRDSSPSFRTGEFDSAPFSF